VCAVSLARVASDPLIGPDFEACKLSATPEAYLVVDTNVALHQARPQRGAVGLAAACALLRLPRRSWTFWRARR